MSLSRPLSHQECFLVSFYKRKVKESLHTRSSVLKRGGSDTAATSVKKRACSATRTLSVRVRVQASVAIMQPRTLLQGLRALRQGIHGKNAYRCCACAQQSGACLGNGSDPSIQAVALQMASSQQSQAKQVVCPVQRCCPAFQRRLTVCPIGVKLSSSK